MTTPMQPGWYDDPEDSNAQRYWDGQAWTPHRQRKPRSAQSSAPNLPPPSTLPPPSAPAPPPSAPAPPPTLPPPLASASPPPPSPGQQPGGPLTQRSSNPIVMIGVIVAIFVLAVGGFLAYTTVSPVGIFSTPTCSTR